MSTFKRVRYQTTINAPVAQVWDTMLGAESYRTWTSVFSEGSYYDGDWTQGSRIRFLTPDGDGMLAEIAEHEPHRFLSIRHIGVVHKGVEDTQSKAVRAWAPAFENYTFTEVDGGTEVVIDQDVTADFENFMDEAWPKALGMLKRLCEKSGT